MPKYRTIIKDELKYKEDLTNTYARKDVIDIRDWAGYDLTLTAGHIGG